jgi:hypothetical protein
MLGQIIPCGLDPIIVGFKFNFMTSLKYSVF